MRQNTPDHGGRKMPGMLVHTPFDRRSAIAQWLLTALPASSRDHARLDWEQHGVALLPLGTLFSAVRIPGRLLTTLTGSNESSVLDDLLSHALGGGPVICDPRFFRHYALVPPSMPRTWREAVDDWRVLDVDCLGRGSHLGVPRVDTEERTRAPAPYWAVPMDSAAALCRPLAVARLIAAGRHCMAAEPTE
ncbi:hypothetical protein [Streptomyces sp. enrichment culture]|uniref:hypothetical protein n=2 Tax=Streptomyces sp. enrichment culture TaxID=1795815 RepID=UPI003F5598EA